MLTLGRRIRIMKTRSLMATEVLSVTSDDSYWRNIRTAAQALVGGALIAFPTETVYGVAASADHAEATERLRRVKDRVGKAPLTVHLSDKEQVASFVNRLTPLQRHLVRNAWPGPLTLIVDVAHPDQTPIARAKDAGFLDRIYWNNSVGLRCPECQVAHDVLKEAGCVVVASSANRKGIAPATDAQQVWEHLREDVAVLLDGGPTRYAEASSIARVSDRDIDVIRQGVLDERTIRRLAIKNILLVCTGNTCRSPMAAGLLKSMLAEVLHCHMSELLNAGFNVQSAGTLGVDGAPATPQAIEALAQLGIDITEHRSTGLTREMVDSAHVILAMTHGHLETIRNCSPQAAARAALIAGDRDVEDPIGGSLERYVQCRDQIANSLRSCLTEITS